MVTPARELRPHIEAADALLADWAPGPAQISALIEWVSARPWRADPDQHAVKTSLAGWSAACGSHWPDQLPRVGDTISRGQGFDVAASARTTQEWLPLLAAAYA